MRVWSLKTCRSNRFQGRAFHSYAGCSAVALMTCRLLLTSLHSFGRGPRLLVLGVTRGRGFLDHPTSTRACGWHLLRHRPCGERGVVTPFLSSVLRAP